jgi:5-(carboxyamino)imidazole ribonucleotide synthase
VSAAPILPGSTIGVVGGGQLGRMLALEARRMGYRVVVLDPDPKAPAGPICDRHVVAPLTDLEAARELASLCDVVTLEWENADVAAMRYLADLVPVRPGADVLHVAQNRLREKETARRLGCETAEFRAVRDLADLHAALGELGTPALLKTTTGGYDAKGQHPIRTPDEAEAAFTALGGGRAELILEAWVPFRLEASVICARAPGGEIASYPVVENIHRNGILDFTLAPARISEPLRRKATAVGEAMTEGLGVIGMLAVELFVTDDDHVLVNEVAPRPHNSGHYTWEACAVSQFEQQLRAVCGLPLGDTSLLRPAAMANLLGEHTGPRPGDAAAEVLRVPSLAMHLYGKAEARPRRKMGHLTCLHADVDEALLRVTAARDAYSDAAQGSADTTATHRNS